MEESADFVLNKNNFYLDNDEQLNSIDVSNNNDPIPPLFVPKNNKNKKPKKNDSIISKIISDIYNNTSFKLNKEINIAKISSKIKAKISYLIPRKNLEKYNSTPNLKNIMLINDLIESKETHFIATFKDFLISDFHEEFLRRYFLFHETKEILPKFYQYYKNYLNFFCKGIFCDFYLNEVMQEYGECQAEFYYNKNYGHKERNKKKEKKDLNELEHNHNELSESENNSNNNNINIRSIFSKSIKYSIDIIQNSKINENQKDLSNIKPLNYTKENSITLPDDSSVSYNDIITNQNSLRFIINMIKNKNELNKKIKNKKSEIISNKNRNKINNENNINYLINNNYKKIMNNNNKNILNKKETQTLSKTNSNANIKTKAKTRIKSSNNKSKVNPNISNYKKYIEFLTNKQRNKSNDPKIKISQDEFTFSLNKINKNIKNKNIISPLSPNGLINHFNFFSNNPENKKALNNNIINNNPNKISSSLFLVNNLFNKTTRNSNKYSTIFPLSTLKNNLNKNKNNNNINNEKEKKKVFKKDKIGNSNTNSTNNKFMNFNPNISIKSVKNLSPQSRNVNNNNYNTNSKPLSYSTVNNCNININNNIILSNNYFNSKNYHPMNGHHQVNSLTKKKFDKKMRQKNNLINKSLTKNTTSRNYSKNDLNRFKTEVNILNILNQEKEKEKSNKNTNIINNMNQYKSFRKSNNYEIFSKMKKYNNNHNNRNLSLKNMPVTVKSNLNSNFSMNKTGKILDEYDLNLTSKTYKHFYLKKNCNSVHQNKIIFDYKRK